MISKEPCRTVDNTSADRLVQPRFAEARYDRVKRLVCSDAVRRYLLMLLRAHYEPKRSALTLPPAVTLIRPRHMDGVKNARQIEEIEETQYHPT